MTAAVTIAADSLHSRYDGVASFVSLILFIWLAFGIYFIDKKLKAIRFFAKETLNSSLRAEDHLRALREKMVGDI